MVKSTPTYTRNYFITPIGIYLFLRDNIARFITQQTMMLALSGLYQCVVMLA